MQQGVQRGSVEGERALMERLLRRRFGFLSPAVADAAVACVSAADCLARIRQSLEAADPTA
ncbi:MAG: hypothetical protein OXP09_12530 [Gammaproteobacteria bacterium]|nr:hypothetical protein [Gammaproteobacteria bacterium]MDE0366387.1 hypothetical protein [Gammaproteobacteria bacterium]